LIEELYKRHDEKNPLTDQDLNKVAAAKSLNVQESPLFDRNATTNSTHLPVAALQAAFRLNNDDPEDKAREQMYTRSAVTAEDGAYVLGLKQHIPPMAQSFDTVKNRVIADFKQNEAKKLARDAGSAFAAEIAKGKTFAAVCQEKNIKPVTVSGVSLNTKSAPEIPESIDIRQLKVVAMKLKPGAASDFVATEDGGFVLTLDSRAPADSIKMQAELPKFMEQIREQRQFAAYNEWFQKQWIDLKVVAPQLEQKNQPKS
jgi:hypothetical protein